MNSFLKTSISVILFILLSSFVFNNTLVGFWGLSKVHTKVYVNNNISIDTLKYANSDSLTIEFSINQKYHQYENNLLSDTTSFRLTDNFIFLNSEDLSPNFFEIKKLTTDSLVLANNYDYYLNADSTIKFEKTITFIRINPEF
jgi:hypothetical protein